jgi:hypothetical protein
MEGLMRFVIVAIMLLIAALPAEARGRRHSNTQPQQSAAEKAEKTKAAERDYKAALDHIPDKKPADPWGGVR